MNKTQVLISLIIASFVFISLSQNEKSQLVQISQGRNIYFPLQKYFYSYQKIAVSDMTSQSDTKNYRLCFVGQAEKAYLDIVQRKVLFTQSQQSSQILYDMQQIIKMNKIVASYFMKNIDSLYVLTTNELKLIQFENNKMQQITTFELAQPVNKAEIVQKEGDILIMTESQVLALASKGSNLELKEISKLNTANQTFISHFKYNNMPVYVTGKSLQSYKDQLIIRKDITGFQGDIESAFYLQDQYNKKILFVFDQIQLYLTFNFDLETNNTVDRAVFSKVPGTNKCKKAHKFQDHLFIECRNHLIYVDESQIAKCSSSNKGQVSSCLRLLKFQHFNVGYHIQSLEFSDSDCKITITGNSKYEVAFVQMVNDQGKQPKKIAGIKPLSTYYFESSLNKVHPVNSNTSALLTQNTLYLANEVPQKKELFCKTVDENSHILLDQPSGNFNGTLTVQGFCHDLVNQNSFIEVVNKNLCKLSIPIIVQIYAEVQNYQFIWYILIAVIASFLLGILVYCLIKNRKLRNQYKRFQDEKNHGQRVLEQTMVTEPNQQEPTLQN